MIMLAECFMVPASVTGSDQFFQAQAPEVFPEVLKEIANLRIVAIAVNCLAPEVAGVVPQLFFYIRKLCIEFVVFVPGGIVKIGIEVAFGFQRITPSCRLRNRHRKKGAGPSQPAR